MILLGIVAYLVAAVLFQLYEAYIGFGIKFDTNLAQGPTAAFASFFWPIAIPIIAIYKFSELLDKVKIKRLAKETKLNKLRIAAQKERDADLEQAELEIKDIIRNTRI